MTGVCEKRCVAIKPLVLRVGIALLASAALLVGSRAFAWDAATTHAGMTEQAMEASKFHAMLAHRMGRALGSFEPLRLDVAALDADVARNLAARLRALDPAGGYRPSTDFVASASAWVRAGAVLAKTPPERGRHHFLEPTTRTGLDDGPGLTGTLHAARLTFDDGSTVRDAATGQAFGLDGMSALEWLRSPQNDLGLAVFFDNWERAVSAASPSQRETALVHALLALGGTLAVLEDAGEPAFVRNDFRGEFLARDSGSEFERFVADRYGAVALPAAKAAVARADIESFFVAGDGLGLAQRTQRNFFSPGTLPADISCDASDTPASAATLANRSLRFPEPVVSPLDLRASSRTRHVTRDALRILAYQRIGRRVHFFLDQAVYADTIRYWLPEVEGYAAGLVDHLLRAKVGFALAGHQVTLTVEGVDSPSPGPSGWRVFVEDAQGERKEIATAAFKQDVPFTVELPKSARKIAAVVRGRDKAGDFVATGELTLP
jgi:hypothetical protein